MPRPKKPNYEQLTKAELVGIIQGLEKTLKRFGEDVAELLANLRKKASK